MDVSNQAVQYNGKVTALLGPTNTGKTHNALERMLDYRTGVIGFPLRLLARENYDRLVAKVGVHAVALITGEEKIIPPRARYYLCTVESMPITDSFEFLAVDEVQLAADPERGHIFTDRVLRARGLSETMFMGAETAQVILKALVPDILFESRPRLSQLDYTGYKKLTRLPKRTAVVAFSMDGVYEMAELIRRQRGGTAVVLGALSPRTRNAQVEMYQSGEVDYLVATDAIGMGLNMDINHVALAGTRKYDGHKVRALRNDEIAQIAGRAGRYMRDGTFGVTGQVQELLPDTVEAIESHKFKNLQQIYWRNAKLDYGSARALLKSLEWPSERQILARGRPSDDYLTLKSLCQNDEVLAIAQNPEMVHLLWDVCQVPDFRNTLKEEHYDLISELYRRLSYGQLNEDWVAAKIKRFEDVKGDVDTLMNRIAHIRTWTYIAYKSEWLERSQYWQDYTRDLEDRLSDALHEALINRFVDRRSAMLIQSKEEGRELLAGVRASGEVLVEGHLIGHLRGFQFIPDENAKGPDFKALMTAAREALKSEIEKRLKTMLKAFDSQFKLSEKGEILYNPLLNNPLPGQPLAKLEKGEAPLAPEIQLLKTELLADQDKKAVQEKLQSWLDQHISGTLQPLLDLQQTDDLAGPVRGICFQVYEAMGIIPREQVEDLIGELDTEMRASLRSKKIRLGPVLVFMPDLNKPAAVRLRALLWSIWNDKDLPVEVPGDGLVSAVIEPKNIDRKFFQAIGYPVYGNRAIRIDMLDRVISAIYDSAQEGKFQAQHKMAEWLGCTLEDLYGVLQAMGHVRISESQTPGTSETQKEEEQIPAAQGEEPKKEEKPELAWFYLKKGKANQRRQKKKEEGRGKKKQSAKKGQRPQGKGKKSNEPRVISVGPKDKKASSPFDVLEQLKNNQK